MDEKKLRQYVWQAAVDMCLNEDNDTVWVGMGETMLERLACIAAFEVDNFGEPGRFFEPAGESTSGAHGDDSLLERWEKLPISQQRMLLDGHAPYIARLEASLAELQGRVDSAVAILDDDTDVEGRWRLNRDVEDAMSALRGESEAEGLPTCPQGSDAGGPASGDPFTGGDES